VRTKRQPHSCITCATLLKASEYAMNLFFRSYIVKELVITPWKRLVRMAVAVGMAAV
jgi:hypothetical protein